MTLRLTAAVLAAVALAAPARAQQPPFHDALADHLAGDWVLTGTIAGRQTTHDVRAEWVLNHQYLRLHETSRETRSDGLPAYDAFVFIGWNQPLKRYGIAWLDVYGGLTGESVGSAAPDGNRLAFLFKAADGNFHTTYVYDERTDTWQMNMENETNGVLKPFARTTLARAQPRP
ncbi:MAG TPA: hypothetical protein VL309_06270 [Vicinamibacterales bacterium]|jgi:hypothetical protein|nr:hypothetical protein [Vicinamibacterales bacterium]